MRILGMAALLGLAACAAQPQPMPLQDATISTVHALSAANAEAAKSGIIGLQACDVTAQFAITSTNQRQLSLDLKPPQVPLGASGSLAHGMQVGNTVTVDFKSQACIAAMARQSKIGEMP